MIYPSLKEVKEAALTSTVIPVYKKILADTETPVSVWMKLCKNEKYSFLLESVTGGEVVARYSFLGANPFLVFQWSEGNWSISGEEEKYGTSNPLEVLRGIFKKFRAAHFEGLPRFTGGAVGFFSYDSIRLWEKIPNKNPKEDPLPDLFFGFYRDIVAFDNKEHRLILISNIILSEGCIIEKEYKNATLRIEQMQRKLMGSLPSDNIDIRPISQPISNFRKEDFEKAVERCKEYIKAGDIFQVVISQRFSIEVDADPFDLYRILRVINPSPYMYFLTLDDSYVIGSSPEMLVRVENRIVEVRPIAGTRRRGKNEEEDEKLIEELLGDAKERAEHIMLVDLGRNDVGRICEYGSVNVKDMMHIEKYSHVIHIVSNVSGKLREDKDLFDALFSCFPAGTLSGAPKIRAMEIIDELENVKRGLYGGALGYIDFRGNMDTCIVIRTIVYHHGTALIQAGAGIVADSIPSREYQETVEKATALFTAISHSEKIAGHILETNE
ncbi:MAG: anthranilate synthase component I [Chitinispirillaceae bacterium]|nr:anthranilate synthase component I [Chitinispirillaceae bacterium]